jgi:hypothetical protein
MSEMDNDDLVNTLDVIIAKYPDEMVPHAVGICAKLVLISDPIEIDVETVRSIPSYGLRRRRW